MKPNNSRSSSRRGGRGGRRYPNNSRDRDNRPAYKAGAPKKQSFWQKIISFFTGGSKSSKPATSRPKSESNPRPPYKSGGASRRPEPTEVTTPKIYVGNLNYETTESDLFELFKGVGQVQNAEIVTHRGGIRSKGFGFVTMLTVEEAQRAVVELHDKEFMGRKLMVNGSKTTGERSYSQDREEEAA